ncbi:MAG: drug/metabolite transporter (DMT)-like permease [Cognaticolwellia sp.]|jgi:drug/metabolite transporter (DMT)-like permease
MIKQSIAKLKSNQKLLAYGTLVFLSMLWGVSFFFIKRGLVAFSFDQVAALRITFAMLAFSPIIYKSFKSIENHQLKYILAFAVLGNAIPAFLFPLAQTQISSSLAGTLNSITPLLTFFFGVLFFGVTFVKRKFWGVLIGLFGALFLILNGSDWNSEGNQWFGLFAILAAFCYGLSSNIIKLHLQNLSSPQVSAVAFSLTGPWAIAYLFLGTDFIQVMQTHESAWISFSSVMYLGLISTAFATIVFIKLVQMTSALFGAAVAYIIPITAVAIGFFDGEFISIWHFGGMGLILFGVYLTRGK